MKAATKNFAQNKENKNISCHDENHNPNIIIAKNLDGIKNAKDPLAKSKPAQPFKGLQKHDQNVAVQQKSQIPLLNLQESKEISDVKMMSISPIKSANSPFSNTFSSKEKEIEAFNEHREAVIFIEEHSLNSEEINTFVNRRESNGVLLSYGENTYSFNKRLEQKNFKIPADFLERHALNPFIRTKMVDWMIEVLYRYESSSETFFLSVNIMDLFFKKIKKSVRGEEVHLIGMASMFIATKFQEIYPICLEHFEHKIGHSLFSKGQIVDMEEIILKTIGMENLVSTSVYDFLKTYFFDFYYNNKGLLNSDLAMKFHSYIKYTSKYLAHLIMYYENFYKEICSVKAIACIAAAIKIVVQLSSQEYPEEIKLIYADWLCFLYEQGGFDKSRIESLASKVYTAYLVYQKSTKLQKNLNEFMSLPYIKKENNEEGDKK